MLVNWTDRLQQHLKVMAIDLETGSCRLVIDEQQPTWQTNSLRCVTWPTMSASSGPVRVVDSVITSCAISTGS